MKSEYESKYGRVLWDEKTRSNYFQMVKDRKNRMWVSANHTPIHWNHTATSATSPDGKIPKNKDGEEDKITEEAKSKTAKLPTENAAQDKNTNSPESVSESPKEDTNGSCQCTSQSCCLQKYNSHLKDVVETKSNGYSVRIEYIPSKESIEKVDVKIQEPKTPIKKNLERRTKHKLTAELPKSVLPKNEKPLTPSKRPISAPPSVANVKEDKNEHQPPFAMYGGNTGGQKQTFNVMQRNGVQKSALKAKHDREKLNSLNKKKAAKKTNGKQSQIPMKLFGEALFTVNKTNKSGLWVTEYQRNFKPFVY